jgi:tripeptidyl-peptidase-1
VDELVKPHEETVAVVTEWLSAHNVPFSDVAFSSAANDWMTISLPIATAEMILNATYHVFQHAYSGRSVVRTLKYHLPESLVKHIDTIQPTTFFGFSE